MKPETEPNDLIQFIGFLFSMGALAFIFLRQRWEQYQRNKNPELYKQREETRKDAFKELLKTMDIEVEEEEEMDREEERPPRKILRTPPPSAATPKKVPHRTVKDEFSYQASLDSYKQITGTEQRPLKSNMADSFKEYSSEKMVKDELRRSGDAYIIKKRATVTRGELLLRRQHGSLRDAVVLAEIIGKPKAFRQ